MRNFFLFLILIQLSFMTSSNCETIKDIQVDGFSIGDKLLNHLSKSEYNQNPKKKFYKDKNVITVSKYVSEKYDRIQLTYLEDDQDKKIYAIAGVINFPNDFNKCLDLKEKILKEILEVTNKNKSEVQSGVDPLKFDKIGKSEMHYSFIRFNDGGVVQIACDNWSDKKTKKEGWLDALKLSVFSKESLTFMFAP